LSPILSTRGCPPVTLIYLGVVSRDLRLIYDVNGNATTSVSTNTT